MAKGTVIAMFLLLPALPAIAGMNPADPGLPPVSSYGRTFLRNAYSAVCVACHGRNPSAINSDNTAHGSHFVYGGAGLITRNLQWERTSAWSTTALSKYGSVTSDNSVTGIPGELICESCHNILVNTGKNKLVAEDNATTDPSPLCEGCHVRTGPGHHLLTGESSSIDGQPLSNANGGFVRNPPTANSGVTYPGTNAVNCRSCHAPHLAQTKTGARVLHRGWKTLANSGDAVNGAGLTGIERQFDIGSGGTPRLVTDFTPLCDACHTASQ